MRRLLLVYFVIVAFVVAMGWWWLKMGEPPASSIPALPRGVPERAQPAVPLPMPPAIESPKPDPGDIPLRDASQRVTKKPFGIFITQKSSPVQPERFSGYHTGTDFEVFPDEGEMLVPVRAVCSGRLLEKREAAGYGGVVVTSCLLDNEPVTVVYGHLSLASVTLQPDARVEYGTEIGVLGQGNTPATDGERKHLHLGIQRGEAVNIRGYVGGERELSQWIDPCTVVLCTSGNGNSSGDIRVFEPTMESIVSSPLTARGEARGSWFFEGSFPVRLLDADDVELASIPAQARGEWMTTGFVPFEATLTFSPPATLTGTLVFEKDNPSGLPENSGVVRIPVRFVPRS